MNVKGKVTGIINCGDTFVITVEIKSKHEQQFKLGKCEIESNN